MRFVALALVMSQLQRTSPVVLLTRVQDALLNVTPGIEVATANEGDCGMFVEAGSVGNPSEHAVKRIVRAVPTTTVLVRNISHLASRGRVMT
jgi:precorrin-3B methylase